jgi:hypothetical protein
MSYRGNGLLAVAALLTGCASYSLVPSGTATVGGLQLTPGSAWNQVPGSALPLAREGSVVWTQDGLTLDRLVIIPAVPDGEPLFRDRKGHAALPAFHATMLPNELEELMESSLVKLLGEGNASVRTANLRPHRYGEDRGVLLDLEASVTDGPDYKGLAGAFVAADNLYVMFYLAAVPYYYEKHLGDAEAIIQGARLLRAAAGYDTRDMHEYEASRPRLSVEAC